MGTEQDPPGRNRLEQPPDAADSLEHRDLEVDAARIRQPAQRGAAHGPQCVQHDKTQLRPGSDQVGQRPGVDVGHLHERVLRANVLHSHGELDDQPAPLGQRQQFGEAGIVKPISVVIGVQADAGHLVVFVAAAQVFTPVGQRGVHRTERDQQPLRVLGALVRQPGIDAAHVLVQQAVEAAGPRPGHVHLPELLQQLRQLVAGEPPKRPARQVDVHVDDHGRIPFRVKIGSSRRWIFPPRIRRLASWGTSAP